MAREYPFVINTLAKLKEIGHSLSINCYQCNKHTELDTDKLIERFGPDHGCMDKDLRPYFYCRDCRAAGRPSKKFTFLHHANTGIGMDGAYNYMKASRGQ